MGSFSQIWTDQDGGKRCHTFRWTFLLARLSWLPSEFARLLQPGAGWSPLVSLQPPSSICYGNSFSSWGQTTWKLGEVWQRGVLEECSGHEGRELAKDPDSPVPPSPNLGFSDLKTSCLPTPTPHSFLGLNCSSFF